MGTPVIIPVNGIGEAGNPDVNCSDFLSGTDYIGNIEYYYYHTGDGRLDNGPTLYNSEGYVTRPSFGPMYHYYRRDHLGNNREVWRTPWSNGSNNYPASTIQRTQYYPSGLPWASNSGDNPWLQNKKYNGKEWVEMHGYDTYDIEWRQYYPAIMRFQTPDPEVEQFYDLSPYSMCGNNMVMNVDPDGRVLETLWDVYNVATGAVSLVKNVSTGNYAGAALDAVGLVADVAAVALPGVPGGAGAAIKAGRVADKVVDVVKTGKAAERVVEGGRAGKTIAKENGVKVKSYGTNDAHKPAHAHVKGGGKEVRVGPNGKPLKGQPELSDKQKKVIENNRKEIRKEVNAVGKENKKIEEQNQRR